jgi:hypothetical protein
VLALLGRKRFPATTVLVVTGLTVTWYLSGYTNGGINVPALVAFYQLGTSGDRRRQFGAGALALAVPVAAITLFSDAAPPRSLPSHPTGPAAG